MERSHGNKLGDWGETGVMLTRYIDYNHLENPI